MTFKHKLASRLALMRDLAVVIAPVGAILSCELPMTDPSTVTSRVVQLFVVPESLSLDPQQTTQFQAYGRTASGDSAIVAVTWSATGGTISTSGMFAAGAAPGDYAVRGTSTLLALTASSRVHVTGSVPVASVLVAPGSASLTAGQTLQLAATPQDAGSTPLSGRAVTWASGNTGIATVSASGLVTAVATGTATISATSEGKSGTASVTVTAATVAVATVSVAPAAPSVVAGQTVQLTATPRDAGGNALAGRVVTWSSGNTAAATVNGSGLVTGVAAGSAMVTATSEGKSGTSSVTVTQPPAPVASVSVTPTAPAVVAGQTVQLTATPRDAGGNALTGRVVTWSSGNTVAATVNGNGLVTGVAAGSATITATSEGKSGTASATVTAAIVPVATVSVTPAAPSVAAGQTVQLTATPRDAGGNALTGRVVTWGSGNTAAATVNGSGLVTGVAAGAATITATSEGKSGTAAVTVTGSSGGGTILFQEKFEDNSFTSRAWYDNPGMATTTAQHIPGSTRALEIHFTPGATTPPSGGAARHLFNGTETVYLSYWVKYSANWVGSGQAYHPHEFMFMTNEEDQYAGPSFTHLTTYVEDSYQNGGIPVLQIQDGVNIDQTRIGVDLTNVTENRAAAGCNGNTDGYSTGCYILGSAYDNEKKFMAAQPAFLPNPGPGYKGDWHFVEAYFQLNSIQNGKGVADGIARYWMDGTLVIDRSNVLFRTGVHASMRFNQFLVAPYIGDGSPVDQTMWVDDLTVATAKP